jgi:hypothetical protein
VKGSRRRLEAFASEKIYIQGHVVVFGTSTRSESMQNSKPPRGLPTQSCLKVSY